MIWNERRNQLVSQQVEVALVYKDMLGLDEALAYLERESVPDDVVQRVLFTDRKRRPKAAPESGARAPQATCRRRNRVHDAIVEAALKIELKLGAQHALALLEKEQVPDEVAQRIIAHGPRQVRAKKPAP